MIYQSLRSLQKKKSQEKFLKLYPQFNSPPTNTGRMDTKAATLTFGDQGENHRGMQMIGSLAERGFSVEDLNAAKLKFDEAGCDSQLISLEELLPESLRSEETARAYILVVPGGVNAILESARGADELFEEQFGLTHDSQAFMYGRVVQKKARHNLCFDEVGQEPDYAEKKGRIVAYRDVPMTARLRESLKSWIPHTDELICEGNYYYDVSITGIGFHGDTERRKVIGVRLGATIPLCYHWFHRGDPVGRKITIQLAHGSLYIMSEKAVGFDWKKKVVPTLRHAAGCAKYTTVSTEVKTEAKTGAAAVAGGGGKKRKLDEADK